MLELVCCCESLPVDGSAVIFLSVPPRFCEGFLPRCHQDPAPLASRVVVVT